MRDLVYLGITVLGNMEGKEAWFGVATCALYATVTTDSSCGASPAGSILT